MIAFLVFCVVLFLLVIGELHWLDHRSRQRELQRQLEHPGSYIPDRDLRVHHLIHQERP